MAAVGRGTVDRALTRAEVAVGLRTEAPEDLGPPPAPDAPFFPPDTDWFSLGEELRKAAVPTGIYPLDEGPARKPQALANDPLQMVELLGYKERPTGLAYVLLDQMVRRTEVVQAIILTRLSQFRRHCKPQEDRYAVGFHVAHRDRKKNLSRVARREAELIQQAIMRTTFGDPGVGRDDFGAFTTKVMRDSLTFDQLNFEVVPSRRGRPYSWKAVDAKTIRLADTSERFEDARSNGSIRCVQVYEGQPIHEWNAAEMAFGIRNPNSSIQSQGYGTSELEMAVHIITALLWAVQYNARFFSQGSTPKGILNFKGQVPGRQLAAFRRFFYQMLSGVENAWRTPVLNAEQGAEWVSMHANNRDMEYGNWLDFLIKLASGLYLMDSAEFGFKYGNENDRSLFESANEQKITQSKDKGLKPSLQWYAGELNRYIVHPYNPDFSLEFLGLDALTQKEQAELDEIQGRTYLMVDELRERDGKPPMANGEGQVILNASWMQYKQAMMMQEVDQDAAPDDPSAGSAAEAGGFPPPADGHDLESILASIGSDPAGTPVRKSLTSYEL